MAISESVIFNDIIKLIRSRENVGDTRFIYTMKIIASPTSIPVTKVHMIDIVRDFVGSHGDMLSAAVAMTRQEYDEFVYPFRENLQCQLTVESASEKSGIGGGNKATMTYRAKLDKVEDNSLRYGDSVATNSSAKNQELKDFTIQLIDPKVEALRLKEINGVIRDTSVDDILAVVMADGGNFSVDIHPSDRQSLIGQLIVGDGELGSRVFNFPAWLQKYGGGVYNHNLGFYTLRGWNYVYPLFNTESHPDRRKLTICSVGPGQMEGIDKTYSIEPGKLSILTTGQVAVEDTTEKLEYELGNVIRWNTPNLLTGGVTHSNGETTLNGSGYIRHGEQKDTLNNSKMVNRITANPFYEVSRVNSNRGVRATVQWGNANPALIYPNMELTLLYKSGSEVHSMRGMVLGMVFKASRGEDEGPSGTHTGNATLSLYLEKTIK